MFETIKISELDSESLELTKAFVQNLLESCENALLGADPTEAATLREMVVAAREMLAKVNYDVTRRSIAEQAAAKARQRQQHFAQAVSELERLVANSRNYDALNTPGGFGDNLETMRRNKLEHLRDLLKYHLRNHATFSPSVSNHNWRIKKIADYLAYFDQDHLYSRDFNRFRGFRNLIKAMRKDVTHKGAVQSNAMQPNKVAVEGPDLAIEGVTIYSVKTEAHHRLTIPYSMEFSVRTKDGKNVRIEVPGLTGGSGPPMTKHLKEFLDQFGDEANVFDAINYCRSWLYDMTTLELADIKGGKAYGKTQLRWEFIFSENPKTSSAKYKCFHIVAKGLMTGLNPYNT